MSSEEERLYARAEILEDLAEPASAVSEMLAGAQGAGVDPRAVISLTAALQTLDPGAGTSYAAGGRKDRRDGSGYGSDGEFLEALSDAEDQVREHLREVKALQEQVSWPWTARSGTSGRAAATWRPPARPWRPLTPCPPRQVRRLPRCQGRRDRSRRGRHR